ncbi:thioesterase II family protein [Streptomyces griseorubiginosus]|uniref:Oleoyl-ACP hydrolase n=1 Tax=Streptomyces griseorubiginosus TaxID=67304 RepID=A0A101S266_9ACTN|nr:alpha/beta fold hydrolase [Streptomyces griseorubiginosus]KUN65975.1 oleoyl-ACP hydrolase [Streptomyces griseorubiginosus]
MTEPQSTLWIRRFQPRPAAPVRLVCLPHAGGSATFFAGLPSLLGAGVEVLAVQYPGRQDRRNEPFVDSLAELTGAVVDELLPWTDRPLALFGHSLGAVLAFEVARGLTAAGHVPAALFVSGRRAPSRQRPGYAHQLDDDGLLREIRRLSGTDDRVFADEELVRMVLPAIRADYRIVENYRYEPGPPLDCPLTVFTGTDDPKVSAAEAAAWGEHTSDTFGLHTLPGGHFFLTAHQERLTEEITKVLLSIAVRRGDAAGRP